MNQFMILHLAVWTRLSPSKLFPHEYAHWHFSIVGAEKALFRALKTKKDTPKYGLIYHAALVGQASTKNKGKISRSLAAKASLATRVSFSYPFVDTGDDQGWRRKHARVLQVGSPR